MLFCSEVFPERSRKQPHTDIEPTLHCGCASAWDTGNVSITKLQRATWHIFVLAGAAPLLQFWAWCGSFGVSLPRCAALPRRSGGCSRRSPTPAVLWPEQDYFMSPDTKSHVHLRACAVFRHRVLSQENSGVLMGARWRRSWPRSGASGFPSKLPVCSIGAALRA